MTVYLKPDHIKTVNVGGVTLAIKQKIIPDSEKATKYIASYVQKGQPLKPCAQLAGTGNAKGITIYNTGIISVPADTTPAEQYSRATWNGNMGGLIVHFYVWENDIWQLLDESECGWHTTDGNTRRSSQRSGETIGGNLDTIAIETIGSSEGTKATAAKLTAYLLREHDLLPETDVYNHNYFYSSKNCPVYLLPHWSTFITAVKTCYNATADRGDTLAGIGALSVGDTVAFLGGPVYASSTSSIAASRRKSSSCKITLISAGAKHPYHLVSVDRARVHGWVDASVLSEGITPAGIGIGSAARDNGSSTPPARIFHARLKTLSILCRRSMGWALPAVLAAGCI